MYFLIHRDQFDVIESEIIFIPIGKIGDAKVIKSGGCKAGIPLLNGSEDGMQNQASGRT